MHEVRTRPPALPTTTEEYLAHRKLKAKRTLNDMVEDIHLQLYEYDGYAKLLEAVYNEHAVEGSIVADSIVAAEMVREKATKTGQTELGKQKLADIAKAISVVQRRYGFSRKERRKMIAGPVDAD